MINYLNLTSGLEWASRITNYKLVRIQSTHFECNCKWTAVLDTDYQFLIDAATEGVTLFDCGSRSGEMSRAQWQGSTWLEWAFAKANNGELPFAYTRGTNVTNDFDVFYNFGESDNIRKKAKQKLRYVGKLTGSKRLFITNMSMNSTLDGHTEELAILGGFRND